MCIIILCKAYKIVLTKPIHGIIHIFTLSTYFIQPGTTFVSCWSVSDQTIQLKIGETVDYSGVTIYDSNQVPTQIAYEYCQELIIRLLTLAMSVVYVAELPTIVPLYLSW